VSDCPECGTDHDEEMDRLAGGPGETVVMDAVDTFRAMVTIRVNQLADEVEDVDPARIIAATKPLQDIASVIMFFRGAVADAEEDGLSEKDREGLAGMLHAVETVTALATLGPMVYGESVCKGFQREWTPQEKWGERWQNEAALHLPRYQHDK